jgi:hypothetical protein
VRPAGWAWRGVIVGVACALIIGSGCGTTPKPGLLPDYFPTPGTSADAATFGFGGTPPPCTTTVGPDGGICGCLDLPLLTDPPNLYFLLDRSGSMSDSNKWTTVRTVVGQVMVKIGPRASFGAALFPNPRGSDCSTGVEVSPVHRGDSPSGTYGPVTLALLAATDVTANGGTPTAATVSALTSSLKSLSGRTYVILATDGGPNCNDAISCSANQCIPNIESQAGCALGGPPNCCDPTYYGPTNCLDGSATVNAVGALAALGVPTYVIGVPGSGPYAALLDQIAQAGGTARATSPFYYPVDTTDQAAFASALSQIAAKITATCMLPLGQAPPDPNDVNVYLDGTVLAQQGPDGWTLDGATVTLLGASCQKVLDGDVLDVRVVAGCPTVTK